MKDMPVVKNVTVGVAWATFFLGSVVLFGSITVTAAAVVLWVFVFLRVFIGAVIPDIRDVVGDREAGIVTMPILYSVSWTKHMLLTTQIALILVYYGAVVYDVLPDTAVLPGL